MAKKLIPYMNRFTGDIKVVSRQEGKKLSEDYSPAKFTKNQEGVDVMRFEITDGNGVTAVVDISEVEPEEAVSNGKRSAK